MLLANKSLHVWNRYPKNIWNDSFLRYWHLSLGIFDTLNYCCFSLVLVCLPAGQKNHWSEPYMPYQHRLSNRLHPKLVFNPVSGEPNQTDSGQTPATNRHAVCRLPVTPTVFRSDRFCSILFRFVQTGLFLKMVISLSLVSLTSFVPRLAFLHPDLPVMLETFCKYPSHTSTLKDFNFSWLAIKTGTCWRVFPFAKIICYLFSLMIL